MKANQKFANADEAVSPVIGVILMVAITVVLAAVVFVLVNNLTGDAGEASMDITGTRDEGKDRIDIITASSNADWAEIELFVEFEQGSSTVNAGNTANMICWEVQSAATANYAGAIDTTDPTTGEPSDGTDAGCAGAGSGADGDGYVLVRDAATPVTGGSFIEFCGAGETALAASVGTELASVSLKLRDVNTNTLIEEYSFSNVAACA